MLNCAVAHKTIVGFLTPKINVANTHTHTKKINVMFIFLCFAFSKWFSLLFHAPTLAHIHRVLTTTAFFVCF